ncbi:MAG: alpha/beta fold hydrolase [Bacteroidota bacterium]
MSLKKQIPYLVFLFCFKIVCAQKQGTISIGENKIHYKTFGNGIPILIINGGPGLDSEGFVPLAKSLSTCGRTIVYDQRGTGKSQLTNLDKANITLDHMVDDIEMLRKHLNITQWVVFGHSFGGMLGSYYVSKFPENTLGLILSSSGGVDLELLSTLDISSKLTKSQQDSLAFWNTKISNGQTAYTTLLERGKILAHAYLHKKDHLQSIAHRLTQADWNINSLVIQNMRKINFNCSDRLKSYSRPVLIIQGENDIIPITISEKAHSIFKDSRLVLLANCGHYGWLEQPTLYLSNIKAYLDKFKKTDKT